MQIDDFIDYLLGVRRFSPRTLDLYRSILENYEHFTSGLTIADIRNYEVHLLDDQKLGARTAGLHMSVLSSYCRFLMKRGELKSNPVRLVRRPKVEKRLPVFYREEAILL